MQEFIIDNQVEVVTAEIEDALATRSYPKALSILKSSWPFSESDQQKTRHPYRRSVDSKWIQQGSEWFSRTSCVTPSSGPGGVALVGSSICRTSER